MAALTSRIGLKAYCLRRLGDPVIQINVDDSQVEDRIDDALQKFRDYHYDGTERVYRIHQVTATDKTNRYVTVPESLIGIIGIFRLGSTPNISNLFNVRYQIHLNDLFNYTSASYAPYVMAMRHIETLEELFIGEKPIRYNRHLDILNIDMDWASVDTGSYIIIDGYAVVDPETYTDVYDDPWIKKYATALIKKQWGANISKFSGMQLPGGTTYDGARILAEATEEVNKMEDELISSSSLPVMDMTN